MNSDAVISQKFIMKHFRFPKTVISRFITRRSIRGASLWAVGFGIYFASKAIGFVDLYTSPAARQKIAETFSNNIGIELILGKAPVSAATSAYAAWNTLIVMVVVGSIWAFMSATKYFRGEEETGRQELLLSGQTTARKASANILFGLVVSLIAFFIFFTFLVTLVGKTKGIDFNVYAAMYFGLAITLGISLFMLIGSFFSQLMPTRSRANSITAMILGISFLLRAISDVTSAHWLIYITPLGWVEKLEPFNHPQPIWLIPIITAMLLLAFFTVYLSGKRDYNESIIADKPTSKARLTFLKSPFGLNIRMNRNNIIGWLSSILIVSVLFGIMTKSTARIFNSSESAEKVLKNLAQHNQVAAASAFLGAVFLIQMLLIMCYAASAVNSVRKEEADGFLDNFLVRPYGRVRWLTGRLTLILMVLVLALILLTVGVWFGLVSQHFSFSFRTIFLAGINTLVPVLLVIGVGIFMYGLRPRLTSISIYGLIAWAFLIDLLASGIKINHWILDTSILHQISLAPAANPNWHTNLGMVIVSVVLSIVGYLLFINRDLQNE
jgi:ABC-2 type transport system permease protein